jgi:hypothetical protein
MGDVPTPSEAQRRVKKRQKWILLAYEPAFLPPDVLGKKEAP